MILFQNCIFNTKIITVVSFSLSNKLLKLVLLPIRIVWIKLVQLKISKKNTSVLCVYPNIEDPTFIFEYNTPAYHYATTNLLPQSNSKLRRFLTFISLIDVRLDTFLIVDKATYSQNINAVFKRCCSNISKDVQSVIELKTTNPIVFAFGLGQTPEFVVREGNRESFEIHQIKQTLFSEGLTCIPKPLSSYQVDDLTWLLFESMSHGLSWFSVVQSIGLDKVKKMSCEALKTFQQQIKVCTSPRTIDVCKSYEKALRLASTNERYEVSSIPCVVRSLQALSNVGRLEIFASHGDFCINNLIFEESVKVVDLEDFGKFYFPNLDAISLAISFALFEQHVNNRDFTYELVSNEYKLIVDIIPSSHVASLDFEVYLTYFILTRLGEWGNSPSRQDYLRLLMGLLRYDLD